MGQTHPHPSSPARPKGNSPPLQGWESWKIDFCFSTMCWVFIDQAAAGVSIRVTRRQLDQELLHAQLGVFLGWVDLPCTRHWDVWLFLGLGWEEGQS